MKEHIEALKDLVARTAHSNTDSWHRDALLAAIELMRAATPKDEAAEREHCTRAAAQCPTPRDVHGLVYGADRIESERAQARAEGYAAAQLRLEAERSRAAKAYSGLTAQLSAQAEIERLKGERVTHALRADILETKLTAALGVAENRQQVNNNLASMLSTAQAEIENQQEQVAEFQRLAHELETKLTNLRAAAEHYRYQTQQGLASDAAVRNRDR